MPSRMMTLLATVLAGLLTVAAIPAGSAMAADDGHAVDLVEESPSEAPLAARAKPGKRFFPRRGVVFNNPIGGSNAQYRIYNKIVKSIRATPRGGYIRVMSWNVYSRSAVKALLAAQRRGVKIRVLMDDTNRTKIPNPSWRMLVRGLRAGNKGRPAHKRSRAKTCQRSCRGKRGQAHAKFFMFSKSGGAKFVFMHGGANLTQAAAINQWNDLYTFVGNRQIYGFGRAVFNQMWRDRPVGAAFVRKHVGKNTMIFSPLSGPNFKREPVQRLLDKTQCWGARKAGAARGRTIIRVAPDVMRHQRGLRVARKLRRLWNQGCNVKIAYTVLSYKVSRVLRKPGRRGPVPTRHLVQDFDGDGDFDNYFHLKALTINGRVNGNRTAYLTVNGSSNASGVASVSDENVGIVKSRRITRKYERHIDYWFNNRPRSRVVPGARRSNVDPYATVDMD